MKALTQAILPQTIRQRPADSYKGTYGRITLIGGNQNFGGAILMATSAAVNSGAGLVTTATDVTNLTSLHARLPESMFINYHDKVALSQSVSTSDTIVVGPGLGTDERSLIVLQTVFANTKPQQTVIIDGSAITMMAEHQLTPPAGQIVYTPHQMEWQRLSGIKIADQTEAVNRDAVDKLHATVVLKQHHTEIYLPHDQFKLTIGTPAMATGGMGDTLAGIVGGFTAQFENQADAILAAVYAHSAIAELLAQSQYVVLPHQIAESLPTFMYDHQATK